jgi:hypothetical protein
MKNSEEMQSAVCIPSAMGSLPITRRRNQNHSQTLRDCGWQRCGSRSSRYVNAQCPPANTSPALSL